MAGKKLPMFIDGSLAHRLESTDALIGLDAIRVCAAKSTPPDATSMAVPGGQALYAGPGSPLTQVLGLGMSGEVLEEQFGRMEEFFLSRKSDICLELCPLADRSVMSLIATRGYALESFSTMLIRKLYPTQHEFPEGGISVETAASTDAERWAEAIAEGFGVPAGEGNELRAFLSGLVHQPETVCIHAKVDGITAGGGAMSVHDGVAALYGASTIPAFRRRGVQIATIQALVEAAWQRGCDIAFTLAEPGSTSQRNLERSDFKIAYTRAKMRKVFRS